MNNDPYAGYIGHDVDLVRKAMLAIFPKLLVEAVEDNTNPTPGLKPNRLRVFFNKSTRQVSRITAG